MIHPRITHLTTGEYSIRAPAKINLGLRVFDLRPDGFHPLESWMVPLSWHDTLTYMSAPGTPLNLAIRGRSEGIPTDLEKNLVGRAAVRLAKEAAVVPHGTILLHKVLPPGGGLGGGSSDAANALVLLNEAWKLNCPPEHLEAIAAELGSDIPFFVRGIPSLCQGRGEIMTPLRPAHPLYVVLLLPRQGMPTGPVFQAFDAGYRHTALPATDWRALAHAPAAALNDMLINDLEPPAFSIGPWLADLRREATQIAGRKVHMTGSGSTLFTLCGDAADAEQLAARCQAAFSDLATCLCAKIAP